jgi:hypothetical protein
MCRSVIDSRRSPTTEDLQATDWYFRGSFQTAAIAGPKNATAIARQFQLDGTGSTSFDGKPLSYPWTGVPGNLQAAILQGNTASPFVQFGSGRGAYTLLLTVIDSSGKTATDTGSARDVS